MRATSRWNPTSAISNRDCCEMPSAAAALWVLLSSRLLLGSVGNGCFSQHPAGSRIHQVKLTAHRARDRLIGFLVLRNVFGGKALNAVSGIGAAIHEERHTNSIARHAAKQIDLDQSSGGVMPGAAHHRQEAADPDPPSAKKSRLRRSERIIAKNRRGRQSWRPRRPVRFTGGLLQLRRDA